MLNYYIGKEFGEREGKNFKEFLQLLCDGHFPSPLCSLKNSSNTAFDPSEKVIELAQSFGFEIKELLFPQEFDWNSTQGLCFLNDGKGKILAIPKLHWAA